MPNRQRIVDEIAALATSVQKPIQTGNTEVLANLPRIAVPELHGGGVWV